jgi:hypothetical protein
MSYGMGDRAGMARSPTLVFRGLEGPDSYLLPATYLRVVRHSSLVA